MSFLDKALELAARGWAVHPLRPGRKEPLTSHGCKDASRDVDQIRTWWRATPAANIGIATGTPSQIFGLDIDGEEGERNLLALELKYGTLPLTFRVKSPHGRHLYFRLPADREIRNRVRVRVREGSVSRRVEGLDVRSTGGYLVAPGSYLREGRLHYEIECAATVADAPEWLLELLAPRDELPEQAPANPARPARPAPPNEDELRRRGGLAAGLRRLERAAQGSRNSTLNNVAMALGGLPGMTLAEVEAELWQVCAGWVGQPPTDPFTREEFLKTVGSGFRAGARRPLPPDESRRPKSKRPPSPEASGDTMRRERGRSPPGRPPPPDDQASAPGSSEPPRKPAANGAWLDRLARTRTWVLKGTEPNAMTILECDDRWRGVLAWNEFIQKPFFMRPPPWSKAPAEAFPREIDRFDVGEVSRWLQENYEGTEWTRNKLEEAIDAAAKNQRVWHPVREYLSGLQWDGVTRVDYWLSAFFGAELSQYTKAVGSRWLIGAVARIFQPGCKMDTVLVLEGEQGLYKSQVLATLAGAWFKDENVIGASDIGIDLLGVWIWEIGELAGFRKAELEHVKALLTRAADRYRPKYARKWIEQPRTTVFAATTNETHYLRDATGNRRFWPVRCARKPELGEVRATRDQIWAEAVARYRKGEPWWFDSDTLEAAAREAAEVRLEVHPWEDALRDWAEDRPKTTTRDALWQLGIERAHQTMQHLKDVGRVLRRLGFTQVEYPRGKDGTRERVYWRGEAWEEHLRVSSPRGSEPRSGADAA